MKAIGYFVVRNGAQEQADLLEAFSNHCQRNGHQPVETFVEWEGVENGRPQYGNMLDYIKRSGSEFLVVTAGVQHLGDTLESSVRRLLELDVLGSRVVCIDEDMPDPYQQALKRWPGDGGARGQRIKEAMMAKAFRGEGLGKPPNGYRIGSQGKLEVIPEEAATVRLIYDLYLREDIGMRRIVRHLNEREVPTRGGGGWSIVTVRDVLRNRVYLGTYSRFGTRVPRSHTAIINPEDFEMAQQKMTRMKTKRVSRAPEPFLLSGLAFCAFCGNKMLGVSRRQGWRRKDGSSAVGHYRYYQCQSRTNQGMCRYHTWRSEALEEYVLEQVRDALESGKTRLQPVDYQPNAKAAKSVKLLETQFLRTLERAASGAISLKHLRLGLEEIDAQREALKKDSAPHPDLTDAIAGGDASRLLSNWDSLDRDAIGHIIRAMVSRVSVGDDSDNVMLTLKE